MQSSLDELKKSMERVGGLARVHESNDESILEKLEALNDMMSIYCELIDKHITKVKQVYKKSKKKKASKSGSVHDAQSSIPPMTGNAPPPAPLPPLELGTMPSASGLSGRESGLPPMPPLGSSSVPPLGASLRDRLLNFGSVQNAQPFAWLRGDGGSPSGIPSGLGATSGIPSGLGAAAGGGSLGGQHPGRQWSAAMPVYNSGHASEL